MDTGLRHPSPRRNFDLVFLFIWGRSTVLRARGWVLGTRRREGRRPSITLPAQGGASRTSRSRETGRKTGGTGPPKLEDDETLDPYPSTSELVRGPELRSRVSRNDRDQRSQGRVSDLPDVENPSKRALGDDSWGLDRDCGRRWTSTSFSGSGNSLRGDVTKGR